MTKTKSKNNTTSTGMLANGLDWRHVPRVIGKLLVEGVEKVNTHTHTDTHTKNTPKTHQTSGEKQMSHRLRVQTFLEHVQRHVPRMIGKLLVESVEKVNVRGLGRAEAALVEHCKDSRLRCLQECL